MIETIKKRNVGILIFDDAEVLDFAGPFEVFSVTAQLNSDAYFNVFTISKSKLPIRALNGLKVIPDFSFVDHPEIDLLIISGGQGTKVVLHDDAVLQWVETTSSNAELTLSICSGARLLAKLGMLNNKPFCTHHEVYDHIAQLAPSSIPQKNQRFITTSEKLFTSGGISAGIDLSFYIIEKLVGKEIATKTAFYMEYTAIPHLVSEAWVTQEA